MVSVLVAIYNVEEYLPRCIDSLLNQTYSDLEIIMVDDCSTDKSGQICDEYAKSDGRIRVIHHQKNEGLSTVRNTGLDNATGDYVQMVDGDDAFHPRMIEILYNLICSGEYDFSMCYGIKVNDTCLSVDSCVEKWPLKKEEKRVLTCNTCMRNLYLGADLEQQFVPVWNKLFKRAFLNDCRFKKLRDQDSGQDTVFSNSVYQKMTKAVLLPEYLYYWYNRPSSLSDRAGQRYVDFVYCYYESLLEIPQKKKYYRSLCLRRMYRQLTSRIHWAGTPPLLQKAMQNYKYLRKLTHKEYWKNPFIPINEKCAMELFYYFPKSYGAFRYFVDMFGKGVLPRWINN